MDPDLENYPYVGSVSLGMWLGPGSSGLRPQKPRGLGVSGLEVERGCLGCAVV